MDVQSILLGFLMHRNMTGYELKKAFSLSFSFFSGLSYGSIYPALNRMERQGLITMRMEIQDGAPNRKIYTITNEGREAFIQALRAPFTPERFRSSFLMRLFFFAYLSPQERKTIASEHLEVIQALHRQLEAARPEIEARADRFQYLCFDFGLRFFRDLAANMSEIVRALGEEDQDHRA